MFLDERDTRRLHHHASLREACINKNVTQVRTILKKVPEDAEILVNMAPNGANTLLFL